MPEDPRPLSFLRQKVDALDHEMLALLARRMEVIDEIARWKRAHAAPVRDFAREREILEDRARAADGLGLPPGAVESIFRLVLWASRDRQAAARPDLPPDVDQRSVALVRGPPRLR